MRDISDFLSLHLDLVYTSKSPTRVIETLGEWFYWWWRRTQVSTEAPSYPLDTEKPEFRNIEGWNNHWWVSCCSQRFIIDYISELIPLDNRSNLALQWNWWKIFKRELNVKNLGNRVLTGKFKNRWWIVMTTKHWILRFELRYHSLRRWIVDLHATDLSNLYYWEKQPTSLRQNTHCPGTELTELGFEGMDNEYEVPVVTCPYEVAVVT